MPDVPNWLQWIVAITSSLVLIWSLIKFLWQKWLSDVWAKRNRESAKSKAEVLVMQFREAMFLPDNELKMHAISTQILTELLVSIVLYLVGAALLLVLAMQLLPISEPISGGAAGIGVVVVLIAFTKTIEALEMRRRYILPYTDWEKYYDVTLERVRSLLVDAGLNDDEQGKFIDRVVSSLEEETILIDD